MEAQAGQASDHKPGARSRIRPAHWLVLCGILLAAAVALAIALPISRHHDQAIADSKRQLQNLVLVLAEQTDRALQSLELVQTSLIERMQAQGIASPDAYERQMSSLEVHELLSEKITGLPHVGALVLTDAKGRPINSSRYWPVRNTVGLGGRYSGVLKQAANPDSSVGEPVLDPDTGAWVVTIAQKFTAPDGELIGMVLGTMELDYFERFYKKISLGDDNSIVLFRRDGVLLARYPHADPSIGRSFAAESSVFQKLLSQSNQGTIRQTSLIDGKDRLIAAQALTDYPLVVTVTDSVDAVLAEWWRETQQLIELFALIEFVIASFVFFGVRQFRSQDLLARAQTAKLEAEGARALAEAELQRMQERKEAALRFDAALSNMSQGLAMFDAEQKLVVCNARYAEVYGLPPDLVQPGTTQRQILEHRVAMGMYAGPDPEQYVRDRIANAARGRPSDSLLELSDGRVLAVAHRPMPGGGWVSTHEDITERRRVEAQIAHMAHHDALTDLPNRVLFRERMQEALARVARGDSLAVLCLDLDHFKAVNDTLGHPIGDALLKAVAERLSGCVRATDTVARLGGDEFAILQVGLDQPNGASVFARRLVEIISEPYDLDGHQIVVGTSVGIALAPDDGDDPDQLLKSADLALYRAKSDGRGRYRFFEAEMDARMQARRLLELDLRKALANGEFELHYQPLVNLKTNAVSGFEALLRWNHPERGMISPTEFVPVAEEIGLIVPIGEWVLRQACAAAAGWPDNVKVAVNLSPAQFKSRNLVATVMSALATSGLAAGRLELEITESVLLQDNDDNLGTLHRLRELGVRISLDDFGTGYSSLSYLRSFPFDKIKIDQSFVRELSKRSDCAAIVRAVAGLGSTLGMATTAEGVETEEQLEHLRLEGCTEVQGYLFSPPRSAEDTEAAMGWKGGEPEQMLQKAG